MSATSIRSSGFGAQRAVPAAEERLAEAEERLAAAQVIAAAAVEAQRRIDRRTASHRAGVAAPAARAARAASQVATVPGGVRSARALDHRLGGVPYFAPVAWAAMIEGGGV
jgi:hypothetical protein